MKPGDSITPAQAYALAVSEAEKGLGYVSPNPAVGCVIVDAQHKFISSGHHTRFGADHAEIEALKKAPKESLKNATMYVTLEPCAHHGKTPPCADRLAQEPLAKVVVGVQDPNPLVGGKGLALLKSKGIQVEVNAAFGELVRPSLEPFLWHMTQKKPFVALKVAMSLDGQIALANKESRWITSEDARLKARELRGRYDATLIGARTLFQDDPLLDFRGTSFEGRKNNKIVIWDPKHRSRDFLPSSQLFRTHAPENIITLDNPELGENEMKYLYSLGISSLYVEGGSHTHQQFLKAGNFNKIYCFTSPCLLGRGLSWTQNLTISQMSERVGLRFGDVEKVSTDMLITAYPL